MLAAPEQWYHGIPADVPDFGPFNHHFVRDIGAAYLAAGVALCWSAARPAVRFPLLVAASLFFGLHALVHLLDMAAHRVDAHHWWLDWPTVYVPPMLLGRLALRARGSGQGPP